MAVRGGLHGPRLITALIAAFIFGCWMQFFIWHSLILPLGESTVELKMKQAAKGINDEQQQRTVTENPDTSNSLRNADTVPVMHWNKGAVAYYNSPDMWPLHDQLSDVASAQDKLSPEPLRIIIATIPRSGNGWIRGMLEAVSGIATSRYFSRRSLCYVFSSSKRI